jgi:quercetin dioxygenase-like cupin family protein
VSESRPYFADDEATQSSNHGSWVKWSEVEPLDFVPGLRFQPVLGDQLMVNFVRFEPNSEAALHWHDEEQIAFVLEGELEFTVAGETHTMRRGDAVVIPPNVAHSARTHDAGCLQVDVFHPPRRGILDAMGK